MKLKAGSIDKPLVKQKETKDKIPITNIKN